MFSPEDDNEFSWMDFGSSSQGCSDARKERRNPMPPLEGAMTTADTKLHTRCNHITSVMGAGVM